MVRGVAPGTKPEIVLSSPYLRAQSTAEAIGKASGFADGLFELGYRRTAA